MSNGSEKTALGRFAATVLVCMIIGGSFTACARRPANSGARDTGPGQAARSGGSAPAPAGDKGGLTAPSPASPTTPELSRDEGTGSAAGPVNTAQTLMEAAQFGDVKLVKSFLARGADRGTLNQALFVAASSEPLAIDPSGRVVNDLEFGYAAIARLLLEKGARPEARDEAGRTPLILAAGHGETGVVKLLLERGVNIEAADGEGATALIWAACNCPGVDMPDTSDSVRVLLKNGANIEAKDGKGGTALMAAATWGRAWILQILLDKGAQIEARDEQGNTALIVAASGGGYPTADAVQMLLARGADIEASDNDGDTALMRAASTGGYEDAKIVKMLLDRGADVRAKNKIGQTALDLATKAGRLKVLPLLRATTAR